MDWIKVTSPATPLSDPLTSAAIPRVQLKALDKAKILRGAELKIIPFTNRKEIGTNAIMFLPLAQLSSPLAHYQPLLTPGDTLWAAGWVIKANDTEFPHSIWNGWMKKIHGNDAKQSTQIEFLPVIGFAIVTFDFPIWLKAVNIIKQANLYLIARLGGFHLLKSYLGSMSNIMEDSGLLDVIQLIYPGSTTSNHIMDGGYFDKAIRAHLLIDAVIYQHIMKVAFTEEERGDMKTFMEKVADGKMDARHSDPVVAVFEQSFEETFKRLAKGGRTPAI